jgi:hypothetical protein
VPDTSPEAAQPVRVPVRFELAAGRLRPPTISVPAFIAIELTIVSRGGRTSTAVLATKPARRIAIPAGGHARVTLKGIPRGSYRLTVPGSGSATLVVGSEPGP